ncbi:MAG: hypothetical protein INR62_12355 [Rhodospirillales bacterium]|nr:hypothetical protein [Acetobacter sp.]
MICGEEVNVQAAVEAHRNPAATPALPHMRDVLQVALEFIDSGNDKEADTQLTRVLEHEPANGAVWMCKALIAPGPDQVNGYAQKGFDCGFAASELKPAMAQRFQERAVALIGLSEDPGENLEIERHSAGGYIDEAHRQSFAVGVHCDFAYRYLALAFALLSVSYELAPSADIGEALTLMETMVNHMPVAGRVIDSPEGYPYEARGWFHYTLPALYELRQRISREFPGAEMTSPLTPQNTAVKADNVVLARLVVGLAGFAVTFVMGLARGEEAKICVVIGFLGAFLGVVFVPASKLPRL